MSSFEPELGQMLFSGGSMFRHEMQPFVQEGIALLGSLVSKGEWGDDPTVNTGAQFENDTFVMRAYCWCDGEGPGHEEGCPPNFVCGDFAASWYKHAGRGNSQLRELTTAEWASIMLRCIASLSPEQAA